ncbi:unnamed protein product [Symbiodinium sp. CCMP2592]|nr:unnamed protein product [Symbiodinium sp. CCMP2592]
MWKLSVGLRAGNAPEVCPRLRALCDHAGVRGDVVNRLDAALSRLPKAEKGMQALEQILAKAAEDEKDLTEVVLQQADLMETFRFHAEELCDPEIWETVCSLDMKMAARIIELVKLRGKPALQVFKESMKFTSDVVGLLADLEHGPGSPKRSRSPPAAKSASRRSKKRNVLP